MIEVDDAAVERGALVTSPLRIWKPGLPAVVPLALLALLIVAIAPIGYVGGGGDDWHYLVAAECWAAQGACLPPHHWAARWPLIAPMAASLRLFGDGRAALMIVPFVYGLLAIGLFAHVVTRLFGRTAALAGGTALLLTPAVGLTLTQPNVDLVELAFLLATLAMWLRALETRGRWWALVAGVCMALAVQTRETSIVHGLAFAVWFLTLPFEAKKVLVWAALGFAAPLAVEAAIFAVSAGDPLLRFTLALSHTEHPTASLVAAAPMSTSPFFNVDRMAATIPANGIDLHWTLNPIVNLERDDAHLNRFWIPKSVDL